MRRDLTKFYLALLIVISVLVIIVASASDDQFSKVAASPGYKLSFESKRQKILPSLKTFQLENGLQVVAIPYPKAKTTTVMVWYKVGSADNPPDKPGLAHYVEHTTFSAMGEHTNEEDNVNRDSDYIEAERPEAYTSFDYTAYYRNVSPERVEDAIRLEASRLSGLTISQSAVESEREAVIDEWITDVEGIPEVLLDVRTRATLWSGTPYGHPIGSDKNETQRITAEDVRKFYETWYVPNNALMVVSGNIYPGEITGYAVKYFGKISRRSVPRRKRSNPIRFARSEQVALQHRNAEESIWLRTYLAPSYVVSGGGLVFATDVLVELLSAHPTGLLDRTLVGERNFLKDITVDYQGDAVGYSTLTIRAVLNPGADITEFETALDKHLNTVATEVPSKTGFEAARDKVLRMNFESWNDPFEAADIVGTAFASGRSIQDIIKSREQTWRSTVTPLRVRDAARHIFIKGAGVRGILSPQSGG